MGYVEQITSQCSSPFTSSSNDTNFCYYYETTSLSWTDSYNRCLNKGIDGILIQIFSSEQFNNLQNAHIDTEGAFWIGANNFASFHDSHWHWLDGSVVDNSVLTWCQNSDYDVAIGAHCAAYDNKLKCVTNYVCNTLLPSACVTTPSGIAEQPKNILIAPRATSGQCTNSYGGAYANWWTYSILLLNWFLLFCFILYLSNHFDIDKITVILTISIIIISFMTIIAFAILWGVQYQDIILLPLIVVILGCVASFFFLVDILILVSSRNRVQKKVACMAVTIVAIIVESLLMIGLILCIAYCSAYVTLVSTSLDKDIIASLLSALITAISIALINTLLFLTGVVQGQDRVHAMTVNRPNPTVPVAVVAKQSIAPRPAATTNGVNQNPAIKRYDRVERATSPVDQRILREFYNDHPKDVHQYTMDGRKYVVYEEKSFTDIDTYRKELTQAMLLQEPEGLREAILHAKSSIYVTELFEDIRQAENLSNRLK